MASTPTAIDVSRLPAPQILEEISHEAKHQEFIARFQAIWAGLRAKDPSLPPYDVSMLETDLPVTLSEAVSVLRVLDRIRVNDAVKAVLAPLAKGADLDNVVARANVVRLVLVPATATTPAIMESDASLLRRYLLAFDRASAGSASCYLYEALTTLVALGEEGWQVAIIGRAIHGRRGDTDIVVAGPGGRVPTSAEISAVRDAVTADDVKPEATAVTVIPAIRTLYTLDLGIAVGTGPDPELVRKEAEDRVIAAVTERMMIGGEVPVELPIGAAYGPNVRRALWKTPFAGIAADPYTIPVCTRVSIELEALA